MHECQVRQVRQVNGGTGIQLELLVHHCLAVGQVVVFFIEKGLTFQVLELFITDLVQKSAAGIHDQSTVPQPPALGRRLMRAVVPNHSFLVVEKAVFLRDELGRVGCAVVVDVTGGTWPQAAADDRHTASFLVLAEHDLRRAL